MSDVVRDHLIKSSVPGDRENVARLYDAYVDNFKVGAAVCNIDREPSDAINPDGENYVSIMRAAGFAFVRSMIEFSKMDMEARIAAGSHPDLFEQIKARVVNLVKK